MVVWDILEKVGTLFYIVDPAKNTFKTIEEVPDYIKEAIPIFIVFYYIEQLILWLQRKPLLPLNDTIGSASQGLLFETHKVFFRWWCTVLYVYVYSNYRIFDLPLDSVWTWCIGLIGVDFLYYWGHRSSHEVNILWAVHQIHHSSEEYNLSTALRLSIFQEFVYSFFYLPMALAVPPPVYLAHTELNLLYQFWLHTEVISSLGPLEYVLNTASHHRVHHGRNRYCIDKNFGGVVIIWDRLFGTFEPESDEKVVYGVTHPINSFEPIYTQFSHFLHIFKTFYEIPGIGNKLSVIFKGPGWAPGLPWHGRLEDIPDVKAPVEKYDPPIPLWCKWYAFVHLVVTAIFFFALSTFYQDLPSRVSYPIGLFMVISLTILGMLTEGRSYAPWLELIRCISFVSIDLFIFPITSLFALPPIYQYSVVILIRAIYLTSLLMWMKGSIVEVSIKLHSSMTDSKRTFIPHKAA